jgi:HlyD family secretion protein
MNKKRIGIVIVLVLIAAGTWAWMHRAPSDEGRVIRISGNIEMTQVDIAFKTPGRIVELNTDEGRFVKKGMILARIDKETMERQRTRETAGVASAESQLAQLLTSIQMQTESIDRELEMRNADVRSTESRLKDLLAGSRPQEIQAAKAAVEEARTQFNQTKKDWDRAQILYKNEDISTAQHDQFQTRYNTAASTLKQVEEKLSLIVEGPRKQDIEAARAQLARSQAAVRMTEVNRLEVKRKQQELVARRAEVSRAKAQVAVLDSQIDDTVAAAPLDGMVLVKSADLGEVLAAGMKVFTIADMEHPWMRGYITETQLGRVRVGDSVKLKTDSYPGKTYEGRVSFIASDAEFTPKQIQTAEERVKLVYRIKVDVKNPNQELKVNMPLDGEITLAAK